MTLRWRSRNCEGGRGKRGQRWTLWSPWAAVFLQPEAQGDSSQQSQSLQAYRLLEVGSPAPGPHLHQQGMQEVGLPFALTYPLRRQTSAHLIRPRCCGCYT